MRSSRSYVDLLHVHVPVHVYIYRYMYMYVHLVDRQRMRHNNSKNERRMKSERSSSNDQIRKKEDDCKRYVYRLMMTREVQARVTRRYSSCTCTCITWMSNGRVIGVQKCRVAVARLLLPPNERSVFPSRRTCTPTRCAR